MAVTIGSVLGTYEITELLGKGGFGEVYRAKDKKLKRDVAIKILPDEFSTDHDRLTRFQREAEILASLSHPNIAAIFDLEQDKGSCFLVLELVEGETLAERIRRRRIPVDEALGIAKQICDGLEAAHEKGVVHRDLKPANIKITPDGRVKVLDFGLARIYAKGVETDLANSATLTAAGSIQGVIIGTPAYMSPEQARGRDADHRSDVFAMGCILYEMLTGRQTFEGEAVSEVLASVLKGTPDPSALPANVSPRVRTLLSRCLEKNPNRRWQAVGDLCIEIENAIAGRPEDQGPMAGLPRRSRWKVAALLEAAAAVIGLALILYLWAPWRAAPSAGPVRLSAELGADVSLINPGLGSSVLAISSDGTVLAFGARQGVSPNLIYIRRLGQLQATPLSGTSDGTAPFFSPDGHSLGFFADGKLKKISVTGGAAVTLCDTGGPAFGGSWGDDGNIVFGTVDGLMRVSSASGNPTPLTKLAPGEGGKQFWPSMLPGGKAVLYTTWTASKGLLDDTDIVLQRLPGTPQTLVLGGHAAQYLASGHIVYMHKDVLFAAPFDLRRLEFTGPATPVVESVSANGGSTAHVAVSQTGVLVYLRGASAANAVSWLSQDGKTSPLNAVPLDWGNPHFSPDGRKLALDVLQGNLDIQVYEWARDTLTRLTFGPGDNGWPVWSPDGSRIVFASDRGGKGAYNLYWQRADGTGEAQRLTESPNIQFPDSFHPTGKYVAFEELTNGKWHLMILPIEGDEKMGWKPGKPFAFLGDPTTSAAGPIFSPDGRWIAYHSDESGANNVFVRPFPGPGGKWQISTNGALYDAAWSRTKHELLYRGPDNRIMAASYAVQGDSFKADKVHVWSDQVIVAAARLHSFDLHPDGERLAAAIPPTGSEARNDKLTFVFNFFDELRRLAPPSKK